VTPELRSASLATRLLYCVALFSYLPAALLGMSGWIGLSLGRTGRGLAGVVVLLLIAAAVAFRIYQVLRYRRALDAFVANKIVATLRGLCILAMLVGGLAGLAIFFIRPLVLFIFKTPGDSGVMFFVVGVYLMMVAPFGWKGSLAFEVTRWIGRAQQVGPRPEPPYRWKQDGIVAAVLVAMFLGGAFLRSTSIKADLAQACKETDRIACLAKVDEELPRMVSLPMGSPVKLVSNVNSIRMQMHSGAEVKWEIVEGVANSLKVSGYVPSTDESLPVMVSVRATESGTGVRLEARVAENGVDVSRWTAVFSSGARLEKDAHGRLNVLAPLPPRSEGMSRGVWRDDVGDDQTIDQLYVFFRRAIGTEVEARESRARIEAVPQSVKRVGGGDVLPDLLQEKGDLACDGRLEKVVATGVRSYAGATRAWEMMELRFVGNDSPLPITYVDRGDHIVCDAHGIWIVHSIPIEPQFSIKRFSPDGILERFVEGTLPLVASDGVFGLIDDQSLREENGTLWFDRLEVKLKIDRDVKRVLLARETFKVQVATR
jgi:hypothetical protein